MLLPDNLIVAALDLIDRGRGKRIVDTKIQCSLYFTVTRHCGDWGRQFYEVAGSTENYQVEVDLPCRIPIYCPCPAFTYAVLISDNQVMACPFPPLMLLRMIETDHAF
jgi:hypothetical protein